MITITISKIGDETLGTNQILGVVWSPESDILESSDNTTSGYAVVTLGMNLGINTGKKLTLTDTYAAIKAAITSDLVLSGAETTANLVTSVSGASTDAQYPSAKLVYDQLALKAALSGPTFTGVPLAPTAATGVITTQLATAAFVQNRLNYYAAATTGTDTYAATCAPIPPALATGMEINIKFTITNTMTATLAINGLTAKTIKKTDGATNLSASDLVVGMVYRLFYDGTNWIVTNL